MYIPEQLIEDMNLNACEFSKVRTEQLYKAIKSALIESPFINQITDSQFEEIEGVGVMTLQFKSLEAWNDIMYNSTILINGCLPVRTNPFVPPYYTVQVAIIANEEDRVEHPLHILHVEEEYRKIISGQEEPCYDFGTYYDEGGDNNLTLVAEKVKLHMNSYLSKWFTFVERQRNDFKNSLK